MIKKRIIDNSKKIFILPKSIDLFVLLSIILNIIFIIVSMKKNSFFDDEVNCFYLNSLSFTNILHLMKNNIHEDAPLFNIISHFWTVQVGAVPFLLRLPMFFFWGGSFYPFYQSVKIFFDDRSAKVSFLFFMLMPYHWTNPATYKWYPMWAFFMLWNLYFFLRFVKFQKITRFQLITFGVGYSASAICLLYTNYFAPVIFFSHFVLLVLFYRKKLPSFFIVWTIIVLAFLPWLPTFIRQLQLSVSRPSFGLFLYSFYVLVMGDILNPFSYVLSIPVILLLLVFIVLIFREVIKLKEPVIIFLVLCFAIILVGVYESKRMILLSPFLAILLGTAVEKSSIKPVVFKILLLPVLFIFIFQFFHREGWMTNRLLDPFTQVKEELEFIDPDIIYTNSPVLFFYVNDISREEFKQSSDIKDAMTKSKVRMLTKKSKLNENWNKKIAFVYHSAGGPLDDFFAIGKNYNIDFQLLDNFLKLDEMYFKFHPKYRSTQVNDDNLFRIKLYLMVRQ